jgi:hypothetical protein
MRGSCINCVPDWFVYIFVGGLLAIVACHVAIAVIYIVCIYTQKVYKYLHRLVV